MSKRNRTKEIDYLVKRTARERWGNSDHGTIAPTMSTWLTVGAIPPEFLGHVLELWRDRNG
jgi:hypothetical protein